MLGVERIYGMGSLDQVAAEWSALAERGRAAPLQRPEWLVPWWRFWGSGDLYVLALRDADRLVGLCPMFIHWWEGRRQVTMLGNGVTDTLGPIAEPGYGAQLANLVFEQLHRDRSQWDICDFQDLDPGSPLLSASPFGLEVWPVRSGSRSNSALPDDPVAAHDTLPHGLRRSIRVGRRRLERLGQIELRTFRSDPGGALVRRLLELHRSRWQCNGGPGSMMDLRQSLELIECAAARFSATGRLRIYGLLLDADPIALILGFAGSGSVAGYLTGFDPAFGRFSSGSILLDYARSSAIAEGARTWDFLRGDEPYKELWGAVETPQYRLYAWHDPRHAPLLTASGSTSQPTDTTAAQPAGSRQPSLQESLV